jgi:broad specificity phosphatase PhoE
MRVRVLVILLACCFIGDSTATDTDSSYTLYLVRHAEKQADGSRDPVLTETGKNRSELLANWFRDKDIKDIWSSDYKRTRDTAKPLLSQLGLELSIYDPRNQAALVEELLDKQHTALVVGHSNTIPELARLLCNCFIADMDDSEHDRLIVILIAGAKIQVNTLQQSHLFQPQN